jgi:hypothetical protein
MNQHLLIVTQEPGSACSTVRALAVKDWGLFFVFHDRTNNQLSFARTLCSSCQFVVWFSIFSAFTRRANPTPKYVKLLTPSRAWSSYNVCLIACERWIGRCATQLQFTSRKWIQFKGPGCRSASGSLAPISLVLYGLLTSTASSNLKVNRLSRVHTQVSPSPLVE